MDASRQSKPVTAVTGATGSIGRAIALMMASLGYQTVLITRDEKKSIRAVKDIISATDNPDVSYKLCDLSRKEEIAALAANWELPLDILINNAAVAPLTRQETPEGIELQFATNVLGYFWTSTFFKDVLARSAPARIVNVASYWAGGLVLEDLEFKDRPYHNHAAYRQSKQANRMLTPVFSNLYSSLGITVNACHPGDVNSTLSNELGFGGSQSPEQGAKTPVWAATSDSLTGVSGKYFENQSIVTCQFAAQKQESRTLFEICQSY